MRAEEFKIGDRLYYTKETPSPRYRGKIGIITETYPRLVIKHAESTNYAESFHTPGKLPHYIQRCYPISLEELTHREDLVPVR